MSSTNIQPAWGIDPALQMVLAHAVESHVRQGWRVESAPIPGQVVLVRGHRVNHILHLLLTLATLGLWSVVWLIMVLSPSEARTVLTVNPDGSVSNSWLAQVRDAAAVPWYKDTRTVVTLVGVGVFVVLYVMATNGS